MKKYSLLASALLVGSLFMGCGNETVTKNEVAQNTLEGSVVDDIIQNAVVEIHKDSVNGAILGTVRSDENGNYSFKTPYKGVVVAKVYCDEKSRMNNQKCDNIITPSNPLLSVTNIKRSKSKLNVSPLSTIVEKLVDNGTTIDSKNIYQMKEKISYIFGVVDPIRQDPIKDLVYKKVVETFENYAKENNETVLDLVNKIVNDIKTDNIIGNSGDYSFKDLTKKLYNNNVLTAALDKDYINLDNINPFIDYSGINAAKSIISSVRTQVNSLVNKDKNGTIDKIIKANKNLEKDTQYVNLGAFSITHLIGAIYNNELNGTFEFDSEKNLSYEIEKSDDNITYTYKLNNGNSNFNGTITLSTPHVDDINLSTDSLNVLLQVNGKLPIDFNSSNYQTINGDVNASYDKNTKKITLSINNIELKKETNNLIKISNLHIETKFNNKFNSIQKVKKDNSLEYIKLLSLDIYEKYNDLEINGTLIGDYNYNPSLAKESNNSAYLYKVYPDVVVYCEEENGSSTEFDGNVIFEINGEKYNLSKDYYNYYYPNFIVSDNLHYSISTEGSCPDNYHLVKYDLTDYEDTYLNGGHLPNYKFNGTISYQNTQLIGKLKLNLIDFNKNLKEKDYNKPVFRIDASLKVKRDNMKDVILNAYLKTYYDSSRVAGEINYLEGNTWVNIGYRTHINDNDYELKINTSNDVTGYMYCWKRPYNSYCDGSLSYQGDKVGDIQSYNGNIFIRYDDGSFESLF